MKYSKSKRSAPKKASKNYSPKPSSKPSVKTVKAIVNKTLASKIENKIRQSGGIANLGATNYLNFQTQSLMPLTPFYEAGLSLAQNLAIGQGTGVSDRTGNSIITKGGYLRFVLYPAPYNATLNPVPKPLVVTQWIFKLKSGADDSSANVMNIALNNWFKDQNSSVGLLNSLSDSVLKANPDFLNILYRRSYKLGYAAATGTGNQPANQSYANNDYKHNHIIKMSVTDHLRKRIRYSDNNLQPLTSTTWMMFTVANADGSSIPATTVPAYINWEYDYSYEDA